MSVLADENSYSWNPSYFQIKDPETLDFVGNVIGNLSKEDQIRMVTDAGDAKKNEILEVSSSHISDIEEGSEKFVRIMGISKDAMKEVLLYFGDIFILDSSALDGTLLG